ncbi:thermonuclease family protein [Roseomonas sp. 18066]|uniref:thermonuclease family protein n=1 Tax=Roseomonas sp. 18066 TaxID=2681412 RepID=UPI001359504C|nr:thermonuclease family protein [Roseomonas sp. 18066]
MPPFPRRTALLLLLSPAAHAAAAHEAAGRVIYVHDGNSLTLLLPDQRRLRLRLADIDAPELDQPFGEHARQALTALAWQQDAIALVTGIDERERPIGKLFIAGREAGQVMLRLGAAWVARREREDPLLLGIEAEARRAGRGLWSLPDGARLTPWEWRRLERRD